MNIWSFWCKQSGSFVFLHLSLPDCSATWRDQALPRVSAGE